MAIVTCELLECVALAPCEEKCVLVRASSVVDTHTVLCNVVKLVDGVSVNEVVTENPNSTDVEVAYQCIGDNSTNLWLMLRNQSDAVGVELEAGTVVAQGEKQGGVKTGWANATTMELTHVNGDEALPDRVVQLQAATIWAGNGRGSVPEVYEPSSRQMAVATGHRCRRRRGDWLRLNRGPPRGCDPGCH